MQRLDARIIEWLEKWCHKFQRLTGKTHYLILQILLIFTGMSTLAMGLGIAPGFEVSILNIIFGITYLLPAFFINAIEAEALERVRKGVANPYKLKHPRSRLTVLFMNIVCLLFLLMMIFGLVTPQPAEKYTTSVIFGGVFANVTFWALALALYLMACDPLPPCESKIKEWLKNTFLKRAKI